MTRDEGITAACDCATVRHKDGRTGRVTGYFLSEARLTVRWDDGTKGQARSEDLTRTDA